MRKNNTLLSIVNNSYLYFINNRNRPEQIFLEYRYFVYILGIHVNKKRPKGKLNRGSKDPLR